MKCVMLAAVWLILTFLQGIEIPTYFYPLSMAAPHPKSCLHSLAVVEANGPGGDRGVDAFGGRVAGALLGGARRGLGTID